jgi:hypothetical protein
LIHLAAAVGWLPMIYSLQLGQPGLFVALGVAASYALLRHDRQFLAGIALGALVLKPQLAFLVPPALLVSGRYRAFWGSVVAVGALAVIATIVVGPSGISAYQERLAFAASVPVNRELTVAGLIGNVPVARAIQVVVAVWALALAYRLRGRGHEWVFIAALAGGLVASPYLHLDDLVMLGLAGWLYLRTSPRPGWSGIVIATLVIAAEGIPFWGPLPVITGEVVVLLLISLMPPRETRQSAAVPA